MIRLRPLRALPPSALYDEAAKQLLAAYSSMLTTATSPREQEQLWTQIDVVRDLR
jgi:hypothetical protein